MIFNIISNREWKYDQVTVTIKGATATSTYDAANHSASGYTVTISDPNYKTTDFSFTGTASATGKNAGTYYMGMTSAQFVNNNSRFRNVVFSVTDGYVSISRKAVTVKADNKSKTYGTADPTLTATVTGTLGSDTVTYSLSRASGSNVGSYTITATGNATQGNYSVTYQTGTLTINKAAASALGLSVSGGTYTYNGTGRSISASVSVTSGTTIQYSTDNTNWSNTNPSYKNAGTYKVYARAVNSNYNTATGNANVVINKAAASALGLSVTGYSGAYDGSNHTITATVTITSGTTIKYSTDNTNWSTTKPTRKAVGTTTVYVKAENSNYNTATATSSITITNPNGYLFAAGSGFGIRVDSYETAGGTGAVSITSNYIELAAHTYNNGYYRYASIEIYVNGVIGKNQRVCVHYSPLERKCPTALELDFAHVEASRATNPSQEGILRGSPNPYSVTSTRITFEDPTSSPDGQSSWLSTQSKIRIDYIWIEDV